MNNVTTEYVAKAEVWLLITTLIYFMMNGAQIFETAVLIPKWSAKPPLSFQMFKGEFGIDLKTFWIAIHSIHELTFIAAIYFSWQIVWLRNWLLILFTLHFAVRVWTIIYFAPNIISFQKIANGDVDNTDLAAKATRWRKLNYLRVAFFIMVSFGLLLLYFKLWGLQ